MKPTAIFVVGSTLMACGISVVGVDSNGVAPGSDASTTSGGPGDDDDGGPSSTTDATTSAEAGADAGPTFCQQQGNPKYCNSFDSEPDGVFHGTSSDGTVKLISTDLALNFSVTVDLEFRLDSVPPTGLVSPIDFEPDPSIKNGIQFFIGKNTSYFQQYTDDLSGMQGMPALGAWHHLHAKLTTITVNTFMDGSIDGKDYWSNHQLTHAIGNAVNIHFNFGVARFFQASAAGISIDNIVIRQ